MLVSVIGMTLSLPSRTLDFPGTQSTGSGAALPRINSPQPAHNASVALLPRLVERLLLRFPGARGLDAHDHGEREQLGRGERGVPRLRPCFENRVCEVKAPIAAHDERRDVDELLQRAHDLSEVFSIR